MEPLPNSSVNDELFNASRDRNNANVKKYLSLGADPNYLQQDQLEDFIVERSCLSIAACGLHKYSIENCLEVTKLLLDAGADPNLRMEVSGTASHVAAFNEFHEGIKLLVKHGADLSIHNLVNEETPLEMIERRYENEWPMSDRMAETFRVLEYFTTEPFSFLLICQISINKNKINIDKLPPVLMA